MPLFVRTPKGMQLTDAGHTLLQETPNCSRWHSRRWSARDWQARA
ncbi:hypothetical protein [Ottowia beijingensis]